MRNRQKVLSICLGSDYNLSQAIKILALFRIRNKCNTIILTFIDSSEMGSQAEDNTIRKLLPLLESLLQEHVLFNPLRLCIMLILLMRKDGIPFIELQRILKISPSTLETNLERLEQEGYLTKRRVLRDLHVRVIVMPTEKGVEHTKNTLKLLYRIIQIIKSELRNNL